MFQKKEFPILVNFIDAKKISVQVHLDDEYTHEHEYQNAIPRLWYVIDAGEASLIYDFRHKVTEEIFIRLWKMEY